MILFFREIFPIVKRIFLLTFLVSTAVLSQAQDGLGLDHQLLLERNALEWTAPEGPYRVIKNPTNRFQEYDFGIYLRKQKVEVRYHVVPANPESDRELIPHLRAARMAMHLAGNDEDSYIAAHEMEPEELETIYQADWGQLFYFPPKRIFSEAKNCQMLALYREDVALCFVFLLFEEAPPSLPELSQLLRFQAPNLQN